MVATYFERESVLMLTKYVVIEGFKVELKF